MLNGKRVFEPSDLGRRIGYDLKQQIEDVVNFPDFYYHLRKGGHVAALHSHRPRRFFCKVDLENFFYSISKSRAVRVIKDIGVGRAVHYGKWSCVKSPYAEPSYALPYGFVQSPILASLTLHASSLGQFLENLPKSIHAAVFVDDISLSSDDFATLEEKYNELQDVIGAAGFRVNPAKSVSPCQGLSIFNCDLKMGSSAVSQGRIDKFHEVERSPASVEGFERYVFSVKA
ncbi:reverse transcriptase domain-containing protein [Limimaricola cinnabarinus]|uniref:reverse transcriptase domain-containing protein n=1 Tax=Limimaricola cinnabarinus TaxID=1125964 RepID=UPI002FE2833B